MKTIQRKTQVSHQILLLFLIKQTGEYGFKPAVLPGILVLYPERERHIFRQRPCGTASGFHPKAGRKGTKFKFSAVRLNNTRGRGRKRKKLLSSFSQIHQVESLPQRNEVWRQKLEHDSIKSFMETRGQNMEVSTYTDVCFIIPI